MIVLGIETSCDETSAAVVDDSRLLSNIIATQSIHEAYGGVVPEFASRAHLRNLLPVIRYALEQAGIGLPEVQGCAVTYGPGLAGSLLVGLGVCKGLALSLGIPWIGINHLEGHIVAPAADGVHPAYPHISLIVSGGHTLLVWVEKPLVYHIVGRSIDDAAGEAFDKVAKVLGLGYPGGPAVQKAAEGGDPLAIDFPRALLDRDSLDFSFSGLKTAVLYYAQSQGAEKTREQTADIASSFQQAVIDILAHKAFAALKKFDCHTLIVAGGVARNLALRRRFDRDCQEQGITLHIPPLELCTDNAGMIARAGLMRLSRGERSNFDLDCVPNLALGSIPNH
ncbi:tRNA (adenosine(37)-N6)-threonylcarbamoyltransferase complex transferase subunit TsaD [candidate division KSB1 bacterium]|nr:tRNA (adenosine(37)-N6)-threonylcarbamoyltransferase complex transferase subunit TsaD [candidate division KSB1 bacterium]